MLVVMSEVEMVASEMVWSPVLVPDEVPEKVPLWVARVPRPRLVRAVLADCRSERLLALRRAVVATAVLKSEMVAASWVPV